MRLEQNKAQRLSIHKQPKQTQKVKLLAINIRGALCMPDFNMLIKDKLKPGWIGYNLVAGVSYFTGIPKTLLNVLPHSITTELLVGLGVFAGVYCSYSDITKINKENDKIVKSFLFLLLYSSQLLENYRFLGSTSNENKIVSDEKQPVAVKSSSDQDSIEIKIVSDEKQPEAVKSPSDQDSIEILQEIKYFGFSKKHKLAKSEFENLQHYLVNIKTQAEDNLPSFYKSVRNFHHYINDEKNLDLNKFWQSWKLNDFFKDSLLRKSFINTQTLDDLCEYYYKEYYDKNLKHLNKKIVKQLSGSSHREYLLLFIENIKQLMQVISSYPIDHCKFVEITNETIKKFSTRFDSSVVQDIELYITRLSELKDKLYTIRNELYMFYDEGGLKFLNSFHNWTANEMTYFHYSKENSGWELLYKTVVWAASSFGVYDTFKSIYSDSNHHCNAVNTFDWVRLLIGITTTTIGTAFWNKLSKINNARENALSQFTEQLNDIESHVKNDKSFKKLSSDTKKSSSITFGFGQFDHINKRVNHACNDFSITNQNAIAYDNVAQAKSASSSF